MKFFEFGKENDRTLMIECGYLAKWYPGLMPFIDEAKNKYHVIVQVYDGFNDDEPDKVFHSIMDEAQSAADFIVDKLGGKLDILYGISLGGMVSNEILMDERIKVHTFIADGYTIMPMPTFKSETNVKKESIRNSVIMDIGYKYKFESFNKTDSYIFHGSAERAAARKVHKLKKNGIHFCHKMFRNIGHAELIHKNPRALIRLIDKAYNGEL